VEQAAMAAVMAAERALGYAPQDVSAQNLGYDIESADPDDPAASLRLIEVKGRIQGARTVTVTRNEILVARNKPQDWILALVQVPPVEDFPDDVHAVRERSVAYGAPDDCEVRYLREPFHQDPDFDAVSVNYDLASFWQRGQAPETAS